MKGDFDAFENGIALLNAVPLHHDFLYGSSILSLLYNPIPRIWWPEKPAVGSAMVLEATQFGRRPGGRFNLATCLPSELYVNFWWPGVVFGMMLFGYLSRVFYDRSALNPNRSEGLVPSRTFLRVYSPGAARQLPLNDCLLPVHRFVDDLIVGSFWMV